MRSKRHRLLLLAGLAVAGLLAVVWWTQRPSGHATPADCLKSFYEASLTGNAGQYLGCLGEPLRTETQRRFASDAELTTALRSGAADLKSLVKQGDGTQEGADRIVEVEEVRTPGIRRVRFRLRPSAGAWFIIGIDAGPETPASVPYGTHISKVPDQSTPEQVP